MKSWRFRMERKIFSRASLFLFTHRPCQVLVDLSGPSFHLSIPSAASTFAHAPRELLLIAATAATSDCLLKNVRCWCSESRRGYGALGKGGPLFGTVLQQRMIG